MQVGHYILKRPQHTMASIETLTTQSSKAVSGNNQLPVVLGADISAMLTGYKTLRNLQLGHKGSVATERGERNASRLALAEQLWTNILTISLTFQKTPEVRYFDEGILR